MLSRVPDLERFYALANRLDPASAEQCRAELDRLQTQLTDWQAETMTALQDEIQKRRQTERAAEQRFQGIVETSLEAIALVDASGKILYNSPAVRNITGYAPEQMVGRDMFDLVFPEHIADIQHQFLHLLQNPTATVRTVCLSRHLDGGWRWVEAVAINALAAPAIGAIVVHFRDVTEMMQAGEALRHANEQLEQRVRDRTLEVEAGASRIQAILDTAVDAIITMDPDGTIRTFNRAAEKMFGYSAEEMIGANMRKLRQTLAPGNDAVAPNLEPDIGSGLEAVGIRKNGERFPIELVISESRLGDQRWFTGFLRDITERKQAEESLRRAKDAAEAANRAKSEFLANMSHEIRTPMNGILGMAELMLETDLSAQQHEFVSGIQSSGHALLTVINDILDFSKIEAGKLEFDLIPFSLRETLGDAVKALALKAHEKGLELTCEVAPEVIDDLIGDPYRLRQVLVNLVGNAVKFTETGEVAVKIGLQTQPTNGILRAGSVGDGPAKPSLTLPARPFAGRVNPPSAMCNLQFEVSDTGIGISSDKLASIFQPFMQADGSITRRYGGTGLGLSISSQLIERMGGRIWIESELGQGSRFHFTASFARADAGTASETFTPPAKLPGAAASLVPRRAGLSGLAVLLAEDNPINQTVAVHMLQRMGHQVTVVGNGMEAVAASEKQPFDVVLMDVQMPGMDGYEATAKIRARERQTGRRLPIIALTAHAMKGVHETCLVAGMDGYVTKPMHAKDVSQAIASVTAFVPPLQEIPHEEAADDQVLDRRGLLGRVGQRHDLVRKMIALFRGECPKMMASLQNALQSGNAQTLALAAHTMKGAIGNLGAVQAFADVKEIERLARQDQLPRAAGVLTRLREDIERFQAALEDLGNEEKL